MTFEFKPGPPKPALVCTLSYLRRLVAEGRKITAAKFVGQNVWKVYTDGPQNYYVEGTSPLVEFLELLGVPK